MCADILHQADVSHTALGTYPATPVVTSAQATNAQVASAEVAAVQPLTAIPELNSRPAATAKLYLDFDGDVTPTWGTNAPGTTPAYDTDSNPLTFSDTEIAAIREIFARVAEKFSPFNLNVTTVNPGSFADRVAGRVVIGGNGSWFGGAGGVAFVGGFYNGASNTCFVFSKMLSGGSPKAVAEAVAHEAGHTFGLQHQGIWDGTTLVQEYNSGTSAKAPVMGNSYGSARGLWWRGTPSTSSTATQDDMSVIATGGSAFGYRPDDHSGGNFTATPLETFADFPTILQTRAGVIERLGDMDVFSFTTASGPVTLNVRPASFGPMLDLKLDLRDEAGELVTSAGTASLGETLATTLTAGTYYLYVKSNGAYGDVGQYSVSGNVTPVFAETAPDAPAALSATPVSRAVVRLQWQDVSPNEQGFRVYRSIDGNAWTQVASLPAGATAYHATWLRNQANYQFKVTSFNGAGESASSASVVSVTAGARATTAPAATAPSATTPAASVLSAQPEYASRLRRLLDLVEAMRSRAA